jgi:hypothetical protein
MLGCWPCRLFEEGGGDDDPLALSSALASSPLPRILEPLNLHKEEPKEDLKGSEDRGVEEIEWKQCFLSWFAVCKWCVPIERDAITAIDSEDCRREEAGFVSV